MMTTPLVQVEHIRKSFGAIEAVRDVSFALGRGEIFDLLGPNGAGKTTTVRIMSGSMRPDTGRATIVGVRLLKTF